MSVDADNFVEYTACAGKMSLTTANCWMGGLHVFVMSSTMLIFVTSQLLSVNGPSSDRARGNPPGNQVSSHELPKKDPWQRTHNRDRVVLMRYPSIPTACYLPPKWVASPPPSELKRCWNRKLLWFLPSLKDILNLLRTHLLVISL